MVRDCAFGLTLGACVLASVLTGLAVGATRVPAAVTAAGAAARMAMVQEFGPGATAAATAAAAPAPAVVAAAAR